MAVVEIDGPIGWQVGMVADSTPNKVLLGGRRSAKTVGADYCALMGHGPLTNGAPLWKGILQGYDVIWVAPDATQNKKLWENKVEPRWRDRHPGISVNASDHFVSFRGIKGGTLWYASMENIRAERGAGDVVGGIVVEEAAHVDLERALQKVILPILTDNNGWLILLSSPNSGLDGNPLHRSPSYFNLICHEIMQGAREGWRLWHITARDNPAISSAGFERLRAEYRDHTSAAYLEEVEAELLQAGKGLAFAHQWDPQIHLTRDEPTEHAAAAAGMDWGYESPGWFGIQYTEPNGRQLLRHELKFDHTGTVEVGRRCGGLILRAQDATGIRVRELVHDPSMGNDTDGGPTIIEKVETGMQQVFDKWNDENETRPHHERRKPRKPPVFVPAPRSNHNGKPQRAVRKDLMHELLHFTRDEDSVLVEPPGLRVHVDCPEFVRSITTLARDPRGKEDVDTTGYDHPYDGKTYIDLSRVVRGERAELNRVEAAEVARLDPLSRRENDEWARNENKWERQTARFKLLRKDGRVVSGRAPDDHFT